MTTIDTAALRAAAEAAKAYLWAPDDVGQDIDAAYIAAASPDVLIALLDRLEQAERERDVLIALLDRLERAERERDALRAERDALHRAATRAVIALAHVVEQHPMYRSAYDELDAAIEAHCAALAAKGQGK